MNGEKMAEERARQETANQEKLLCPKAGTATSSPIDKQSSRIDMVIPNVMLWMQKNAYEPTTIRKTAKLLRHLKSHCDTADPEVVKFYISKKQCSNAHKENLIEAYAMVIKSLGLNWEQPFYTRYSKKRRAPKEELINFIIQHTRIEMATKLAIIKDLGTRPKARARNGNHDR